MSNCTAKHKQQFFITQKTKGDYSTAQGNTKEWGYKQIKKDK